MSSPVTKRAPRAPDHGDAHDLRPRNGPPWARPAAEVLAEHGVGIDAGLSEADARARLQAHGKNRLREARRIPAMRIFFDQLKSVLVVLLLVASALSFAVGDALEGAAIAVAIGLTIALGFATELRATRSMEALRRLGAVRARVRRGGVERLLPADELVPGDIVVVEGGDRVTADVRVAEASKLQADESALTGESIPVGKNAAPLPAATELAERTNMLYKGATVTRGAATGVVVATGMATELGRIAALVDAADHEATPLERRLAALGHKLLWICLAVAAVTAVAGILRGRPTMLMIETGIALAVAAVPEGLPVVATIALARGMWRLAARHALIERLSAVETLGATSVIVADKTGTLTENRMSVVALYAGGEEYEVAGVITRNARPVDIGAAPALRTALEISVLCNNAAIHRGDATGDGGEATGDPLEVALLRAGAIADLDRDDLVARWPEIREEAFDPDVKMMATVHRADDGVRVAVKGAPEAVLAASVAVRTAIGTEPLTAKARRALALRGEEMASDGLRILAVAEKRAPDAATEVYGDLVFVGLIGLADPPRRDVIAPIAACHRAGVRVVMATGDQPATAASIARAVHLVANDAPAIVHGSELGAFESLSESERRRLRAAEVFARVTPEQKLDIIALHQSAGDVVAMTGDGVNDAPALRKAEIGVAMGRRGTDVAREAAAMVLEDDSFESIVAAIEQGRAIFENIRRFVVYLLSCNLSEILVVAGAVLLGAPLPLLPLQILFLNLVTDVFPALALGFGAGDATAMSRPPRDAREPIVGRRQWAAVAVYAALLTAAVLGASALARARGATGAEATSISFLTLGFAQLWHVFDMRGRDAGVVANDVVRNPWVWGALALCTALLLAAALGPGLADVLDVAPLSAEAWGIVLVMSALPTVIAQVALALAPRLSRIR